MSNIRKTYERLIGMRREIAVLESCACLLQWDQETCLPREGASFRADQLALLARLAHEKSVSPQFGECLAACEKGGLAADPLSAEAVNLREIRHRYDKKVKLPERLVEELAHTAALAHPAWVEARRQRKFELFRPWLEKLVRLKREQAAALGFSGSLYDGLLDDYEPGETQAHLEILFPALREGLVRLLEKISGAPRQPDDSVLRGSFPLEKQKEFGRMASAAIGFDFDRGRLDEVVHPFCLHIGPGDTRITTRYSEERFGEAFFGILHESGHGLYEQGLPTEQFGTPLGESVYLGIHESQSTLWETLIGRDLPFWKHFFPLAQKFFPGSLGQVGLESFLRAINFVRPSFIRVSADEVSYHLHIILRFELEKALIAGELAPADVPAAWNGRFKELLGLEVPDDSSGCLQDVHWSAGLFGYFPTYSLGYLNAAQFYVALKRDLPGLEEDLARGKFSPVREWLREKIHCQGMRYRPAELIRKVTGEPLSTRPLLAYLEKKFSELYGF